MTTVMWMWFSLLLVINVVADSFAGERERHTLETLLASRLSWVSGAPPVAGQRLTAKVRYRQADQACTVREVAGDRLVIDFPALQRVVTPGQSVVLYDGDSCLGGGIIDWARQGFEIGLPAQA